MVNARTVLKTMMTTAAVTAATLTGGPPAGASLAAFLASPAGQKTLDASIDTVAAREGVVIEDLARGGLVTQPTFGFTGEMGPELVLPLSMPKPKRPRSRSARAADKKLSKAFKEANARYRLKNGSLRKGRTQADIAKLAHKLRKKM